MLIALHISSVAIGKSSVVAVRSQIEAIDGAAIQVLDNGIGYGSRINLDDSMIFNTVLLKIPDTDDFCPFDAWFIEYGEG